ncbi:MAG: tyrosinase family protein [Actinomycetota bacterium]|nr:tyrosinase family protein [Actinomycetota bacterium]MDQ2956285.1 tyrosinase family protein [Actinomycetota bacterium]
MAQPFVRVDVWTLAQNDPIVTAYANAVAAMKAKPAHDPTSWAYQAAIHGTYTTPPLPQWNQCRHGTWYFVSWHRMYLYYFERIVRAQVIANGGPRNWALPYWNYDGGGTQNTLPLAFRNPTMPNGSANPLYVAQRNPGINSGAGLPGSITSPAFALSRPTFTGASEFGGGITSSMGQFWGQTGRLEQTPHNDVHVAVGGLMGDPDTAAQDPIFWLHHANIDRVWWLWAPHHSNPTDPKWTTPSFSFVDVGGTAASLTSAGVENTVSQLDYTYDHAILRFPWPPRRLERLPVKWPWPWPERPDTPREPVEARPAPEVRQLVGATEQPIQLVGNTERVPVQIDQRSAESLRATAPSGAHEHRAFLDVEDITAERNPGTVYGVYVNLPADPTDADIAAHHVGNVSLFGVERARNPRGDEHAHGLRLSMEITDLLDQLAEAGSWQEGQRLDVTFRPISLEAPADVAGVAPVAVASTAHPELPVTIGRVSVHFA